VSYFLNQGGDCKLVVTLAEEPNWEGAQNFVATRFEATVLSGKTTRYQSGGKTIDFACDATAQSMDVTIAPQFAGSPAE